MFCAVFAAGLSACQRPALDAASIPHTPIPKTEPRLWMAVENDRLRYQGTIADNAARDAITAELSAEHPRASGTLVVNTRTLPAPWINGLGRASALLSASGGRLDFVGKQIALSGELSGEARATLLRRIQRLYPGYQFIGAFLGVDPRLALPDEGDERGLLTYLSAGPIGFHEGTALLTPGSLENLARAARGMQAAGNATRVEIRVHEGTGADPAARQEVGQQRVGALRTQLALRGVVPRRMRITVVPAQSGREDTVEFAFFPAGAPMSSAAAPESDDRRAAASAPGRVRSSTP